ncbi:hypothetical protein Lal_00038623 [Lupinus albus]|nr:hypothetical protein Lal_00038623 [Lupinus albus]
MRISFSRKIAYAYQRVPSLDHKGFTRPYSVLNHHGLAFPWILPGEEDLDSRSNPTQEGGDDGDPPKSINMDELMGLGGPMTRAKAKKARDTLGQVILSIHTSIGPSDNSRPINCLMLEATSLEGYGQEGQE